MAVTNKDCDTLARTLWYEARIESLADKSRWSGPFVTSVTIARTAHGAGMAMPACARSRINLAAGIRMTRTTTNTKARSRSWSAS